LSHGVRLGFENGVRFGQNRSITSTKNQPRGELVGRQVDRFNSTSKSIGWRRHPANDGSIWKKTAAKKRIRFYCVRDGPKGAVWWISPAGPGRYISGKRYVNLRAMILSGFVYGDNVEGNLEAGRKVGQGVSVLAKTSNFQTGGMPFDEESLAAIQPSARISRLFFGVCTKLFVENCPRAAVAARGLAKEIASGWVPRLHRPSHGTPQSRDDRPRVLTKRGWGKFWIMRPSDSGKRWMILVRGGPGFFKKIAQEIDPWGIFNSVRWRAASAD